MGRIQSDLLARVERAVRASGLTPTAFGRRAVNDPRFVFDLRRGRSCTLDTLERVLDFADTLDPAESPVDSGGASGQNGPRNGRPAMTRRRASVERKTAETHVAVTVDLDGTGRAEIATGIGFLDHMLDQLARHGLIDLEVRTEGDLHIDGHHTVEDTAIVVGQAVAKALGDRAGIRRFGQALSAMDETLTRVVVDVSGRPYLVWNVAFDRPRLGALDTELVRHWFHSFALNAGLTLHVETLYGSDNHHICESCFKGLARALREAVEADPRRAGTVPSTKGVLGEAT